MLPKRQTVKTRNARGLVPVEALQKRRTRQLPLSNHRLLVMLDGGKRVVKVMQQFPPLLISRRLPEAHRVILERPPMDQQQVAAAVLDATPKLVRLVPGH